MIYNGLLFFLNFLVFSFYINTYHFPINYHKPPLIVLLLLETGLNFTRFALSRHESLLTVGMLTTSVVHLE